MKKLLVIFLGVLMVSTFCFSPIATAQLNQVDSQAASLVAANHIKAEAVESLNGWANATISTPLSLYGLDEKIKAYGFNVLKDSNIVGYIIVNSDKNDAPVPEFGVGSGLPFQSGIDQARLAAEKQLKAGESLDKEKVIYLSALTYTVEFPVYEGQHKLEPIFVDIHNGKILQRSDFASVSAESENQAKNNKAWEHLSTNSIVQPMNNIVERIIAGVPFYAWYRGCAPTSAGMVMAYWRGHGYPQLPIGNALIDQLANAMGTDRNGNTITSNIPGAITYIALYHGYNWTSWNDGEGRAASTYAKYKNEIYNGFSVVTNMYGSSIYGNHTVAGVGYRFDDYQQWIIVHDTWNTTNNIYLDYNSTEVNDPLWTYVHP
ncbi:MAG: C39 family peptidase [Thermacetogeniaceae bacterium]